mgnify:CR=1 FL=1|tara:strand:+ start:2184 stop:2657 length:474 start_codon:yes stop_codon:yes gene_type:complete
MKQNLLIIIIIIFSITSGCGFKKLDKRENRNFVLFEINLEGNKKINYRLKNKLTINNPKEGEYLLVINLENNKKKFVIEKNIRNEVTKYQIVVSTNVSVKIVGKETVNKFNFTFRDDYSVADNYSTTLNNEKISTNRLVDRISKKILEEIKIILNDN